MNLYFYNYWHNGDIHYSREFVKDIISKTNFDNYFYAHNGMVIKNLGELQAALEKMDEGTFNYHMNSNKNDFVNWIRDCIKDLAAAALLEKAKTRAEAVNAIKHRLKIVISH